MDCDCPGVDLPPEEPIPSLLSVGRRPLAITAPCRVVYTVTDDGRQGFAYGTLLGHPESGEESFIVTRGADDRVTFTVRASPGRPRCWRGAVGRSPGWPRTWQRGGI